MDISRRSFLKYLPLGLFPASALALASPSRAEFEGIARWFTDPAATSRMAQAYLSSPDFDAPALLVLAEELRSAPNLQQQMATRIEADFVQGNMTVVDGWVLSRSEAALCVLATAERAQG